MRGDMFHELVLEPVRKLLDRSRIEVPRGGRDGQAPVWSVEPGVPPRMVLDIPAMLLCGNMQEDLSAAPAFLLCLALWQRSTGTPWQAVVRLRGPAPVLGTREALHWNRSRILLEAYASLFRDFYRVEWGDSRPANAPALFDHGTCLNQAVDEDARTGAGRGLKPEDRLERFFISSDAPGSPLHQFNARFGNVVGLKRQLPVGLFHSGKVSLATQLTPGKKSAVDVWGASADGSCVHLFELKAEGNVALGMLAEAFYYLWVLSHFRLGLIGPHDFLEDRPLAQIRRATQLKLWLTAPALHPLIGDGQGPVLRAFNAALLATSAEIRPLLFKGDVKGEVLDVTLLSST